MTSCRGSCLEILEPVRKHNRRQTTGCHDSRAVPPKQHCKEGNGQTHSLRSWDCFWWAEPSWCVRSSMEWLSHASQLLYPWGQRSLVNWGRTSEGFLRWKGHPASCSTEAQSWDLARHFTHTLGLRLSSRYFYNNKTQGFPKCLFGATNMCTWH